MRSSRSVAIVATLLMLAALAVGCGGSKKEAEGDIVWLPVDDAVVAEGPGVLYPAVNPGGLPAEDIRRVSDVVPAAKAPGAGLVLGRGSGDPFTDDTVIVRRMPDTDREAVLSAFGKKERLLALADGRDAALLNAGELDGTCARGLAVEVPGGDTIEILTVTGDRDDLLAVIGVADLGDGGEPVVESPPAGWRPVGMLPGGWTDRPGASQLRYRLLGGTTVTAVRTNDAEQRVLAAQFCRDPRAAFPPSGSLEETDKEWVGNLGSQIPRKWFVRGRLSYLGLLDGHTQVVLVPGEPGLTLLTDFEGDPELNDGDLATYAQNLVRIGDAEFDSRATQMRKQQIQVAGEVARLALEERGHEVLPIEERDGLAWRFSLAPASAGDDSRPMCLTVVRRPDGRALLGHLRRPVPDPVCADPSTAVPSERGLEVPDPEVQLPTGVVWGFAGPGVARVRWSDESGGGAEAVPTGPVSGAPDARSTFVVSVSPTAADPAGGPGALVALDAEGSEIGRFDLPER